MIYRPALRPLRKSEPRPCPEQPIAPIVARLRSLRGAPESVQNLKQDQAKGYVHHDGVAVAMG